ncbi:MAG TPA: hypothetical protein VNT52_02265 [Acidimicrobiales bacterium]|nr:hypothetical protein [Acidimicrobiales bacterium]
MRGLVVGLIVGLMVVGTLCTVALVGKPRKPIDGATAVGTVILNALVVWGVVYLWQSAS